MSVLAFVDARARMPATLAASFASRPKLRTLAATMSDAVARSIPSAAAAFRTPRVASMISADLNPAWARFVIASAAWVAEEKTVVAPRVLANDWSAGS